MNDVRTIIYCAARLLCVICCHLTSAASSFSSIPRAGTDLPHQSSLIQQRRDVGPHPPAPGLVQVALLERGDGANAGGTAVLWKNHFCQRDCCKSAFIPHSLNTLVMSLPAGVENRCFKTCLCEQCALMSLGVMFPMDCLTF